MENRPALQIQTMVKAMLDVIIPAIDPDHRLAQEQAGLVVATLGFMASRMPMAFCYDRQELDRFVALARQLTGLVQGGEQTRKALDAIAAAADTGAEVLERARAEPSELETAIFALRAEVSALVRSFDADGAVETREALAQAIMASGKEQLEWERAWLMPHGFDPEPGAVPPIETLIETARAAMRG